MLNTHGWAKRQRSREGWFSFRGLIGPFVWCALLAVLGMSHVAGPRVLAATPVAATPVAETITESVSVYFLRPFTPGEGNPSFDVIAAGRRDIAVPTGGDDGALAEAALAEMIAGPNADERQAGLTTRIPADLDTPGVVVAERGVATVELPVTLMGLEGDDELGLQLQLAQIVYTLTAVPSVEQVLFRTDGGPLPVDVPEINLTGAVDRGDFAAQAPPILVESPTVAESVTNPVNVRGTANTYGGDFQILIEQTIDGQDVVLAEMPVQTSGSGTRGDFEVSVELPAGASGPARLVTYQTAGSGAGGAVDRAEIPIVLSP